eukprot:gb/GECG01005371.1/.p1 GENE.gb/GECG01005371.1/~~gb/GECG01005371.1/.p1  ORF type:complete len:367 (+),score=22.47 gb/GECG01005371.1/:1-1101(+)
MKWRGSWIPVMIRGHRSLLGLSTALCSYFHLQQTPVHSEAYPPNFLGASPHATLHEIDTVEWRIDKWSAFHPRAVCTAAIRGTVQVKGDSPVFGNGVLITSQGHILTCAHLVHTNKNVCVEFADNQTYRTRLVGIDWDADLAILQVVGQPIGRYYEWFNDLAGVDYRRAQQEQKSSAEQDDLKQKTSKLAGGNQLEIGPAGVALLDHTVSKAALEATHRAERRRYRSVAEVSSFVYDIESDRASVPQSLDLAQWQYWWRSVRIGDRVYRLYHRILERNWRLGDEDRIGGERLRAAAFRERHGENAGPSDDGRLEDTGIIARVRWLLNKLRRSHSFLHPLELATHEALKTIDGKQDPFFGCEELLSK